MQATNNNRRDHRQWTTMRIQKNLGWSILAGRSQKPIFRGVPRKLGKNIENSRLTKETNELCETTDIAFSDVGETLWQFAGNAKQQIRLWDHQYRVRDHPDWVQGWESVG